MGPKGFEENSTGLYICAQAPTHIQRVMVNISKHFTASMFSLYILFLPRMIFGMQHMIITH